MKWQRQSLLPKLYKNKSNVEIYNMKTDLKDTKIIGQLHIHLVCYHHGKTDSRNHWSCRWVSQDAWGRGPPRKLVKWRMFQGFLPFWKNSSSFSLKGWRYCFGDSLHTTAICFSLAVKRSLELDFSSTCICWICALSHAPGDCVKSLLITVYSNSRGGAGHKNNSNRNKSNELTLYLSSGTGKCTFSFPL